MTYLWPATAGEEQLEVHVEPSTLSINSTLNILSTHLFDQEIIVLRGTDDKSNAVLILPGDKEV